MAKRTPIASNFWLPVYQADDGSIYSDGQTGNTIVAGDPWSVVTFPGVAKRLPAAMRQALGGGAGTTPGIARVMVQKNRAVDRKPGAGTDGERLTIHGDRCGDIQIEIEIWTPAQWEVLKAMWPILKVPAYKLVTSTKTVFTAGPSTTTSTVNPVTGAVTTQTIPSVATKQAPGPTVKLPITFDVSHPALKLLGIKAVQITGARGPIPGRYPQSRVFTIECVEYLPPGKANATKTDDSPIAASTLQAVSWPTPGSDPSNTGP